MKPLTELELDNIYMQYLDDVYGNVIIAGLEYNTSFALKQVDPTAFRCGMADFLDSERSNGTLFEKDGEYYNEDPNE